MNNCLAGEFHISFKSEPNKIVHFCCYSPLHHSLFAALPFSTPKQYTNKLGKGSFEHCQAKAILSQTKDDIIVWLTCLFNLTHHSHILKVSELCKHTSESPDFEFGKKRCHLGFFSSQSKAVPGKALRSGKSLCLIFFPPLLPPPPCPCRLLFPLPDFSPARALPSLPCCWC